MKIRSVTVFTDIPVPFDRDQLKILADFAHAAKAAFEDAGYEVQTTRLATDLFPALEHSPWAESPEVYVQNLETTCNELGFAYISLGPATEDMLPKVPDILRATESVFATASLLTEDGTAIDRQAVMTSANVIRQASDIAEGFGNLRFAALANVPTLTPFFPGSFHDGGSPAFAVACECADLAVTAAQEADSAMEMQAKLIANLEENGAVITNVASELSVEHDLRYAGIDFSLAPFPNRDISIGHALELISGQPLGAAGTLAAASLLADALQQAQFPHAGFCGNMMPVLEDTILAQRAAEGTYSIGNLLQWSAVCGTGLDTVPIPGNASQEAIMRLLYDVAALSLRLNKPLTARLMPLPGKVAGDPVHFDFAFFADGGVLPLDEDTSTGLLAGSAVLSLHEKL